MILFVYWGFFVVSKWKHWSVIHLSSPRRNKHLSIIVSILHILYVYLCKQDTDPSRRPSIYPSIYPCIHVSILLSVTIRSYPLLSIPICFCLTLSYLISIFLGVWFGGMIRGMIRGYDSHNSNIMPFLKSAHVKKRHSHMYIYIYINIYIYTYVYMHIPLILQNKMQI